MDKKSKTPMYIAGLLGLALIAGGVVWAINRNEDTTSSTTTPMTQSTATPTPRVSQDIVSLASITPSLTTLVQAVQAGNLVTTLQGEGPFTVFAPTNDAFSALPAGTLDSLLQPANVEQLRSILTYHVVSGKILASSLSDGQQVSTVQGGTLTVRFIDGRPNLIDAKGNTVPIQATDIEASNGVVHVIGGVLLP